MLKLSKRSFIQLVCVATIIFGLFLAFVFLNDTQLWLHSEDKLNEQEGSIFGRSVYNNTENLGKIADPNYQITYPKDHLEHSEFDIEWWYLTANLEDEQGQLYGIQWTLFRFRNPSAEQQKANTWNNEQIYMAHASVHSIDKHWFTEKFAKGGVGNAGVSDKPLTLFIDDWKWVNKNGDDSLFPANLQFTANSQFGEVKVDLHMQNDGPFIKQGEQGYSIKSANGEHASHYYSAPFIKVRGNLDFVDSTNLTTTEVSGDAWYDHEWTSQLLDTSTQGWDWLSLHLDNGSKIMAFRMRLSKQEDYITGSYISASGAKTHLSGNDISLQAIGFMNVGNKNLPLTWQLTIPEKDINVRIQSLKTDQWNQASVSYYEGMVTVDGSNKGKGFLELTGY